MTRSPSPTNRVLDAAMGTYTRYKVCECGYTEKTVEMRMSDLCELRRLAHLYIMSQARSAE